MDTDPTTEPRPNATREDGVTPLLRERERELHATILRRSSDSVSPVASGPRKFPGPRPEAHTECVGVVAHCACDHAAPPKMLGVDRVHGYERRHCP